MKKWNRNITIKPVVSILFIHFSIYFSPQIERLPFVFVYPEHLWVCPGDVLVKAMDWETLVSDFERQFACWLSGIIQSLT